MRRALAQIGDGWESFWFTPQPTSTLALFRVAFGLVAMGWTATLAPDLFALFGADGILPDPVRPLGAWGVLTISDHPAVIVALWVTTLIAAAALTVGYRTRIAAIVVFVGILSFQRANPMIINSGDGLICNLALYCALAPCGTSLSLDRLRTARDRFWEFPARAPWALRLVQIQLSVMYLSTVWHKMQGDTWRDGSAVSYALRLGDIHRFATPTFLTDSVILTEIMTFGTLALELSLAILVWNRAARPWILGLGVSLHLGIEYSILVGFFGFTVLTAYLAFTPAETASRWVLSIRDRLASRPTAPEQVHDGRPEPVEPRPETQPTPVDSGPAAARVRGNRPREPQPAGPAR